MIETNNREISIRRQCDLIGLPRASYYYPGYARNLIVGDHKPGLSSAENLMYMRLIDEQYLKTPFYGSRRMAVFLNLQGYLVNRKRIQRLMRLMGIQALYPSPKTSIRAVDHQIYPYLLRNVQIGRTNQVWSADITYIPLEGGFMYLVAIIDWYSRFILSWRLSNTLDTYFCLEALEEALQHGRPEIFNTDQGVQFTSKDFTEQLKRAEIQISMDGRGRALDNIFIERFWRSVKYEDIYLKNYPDVPDLVFGLDKYFSFYNHDRPHQSLEYKTPAKVYYG